MSWKSGRLDPPKDCVVWNRQAAAWFPPFFSFGSRVRFSTNFQLSKHFSCTLKLVAQLLHNLINMYISIYFVTNLIHICSCIFFNCRTACVCVSWIYTYTYIQLNFSKVPISRVHQLIRPLVSDYLLPQGQVTPMRGLGEFHQPGWGAPIRCRQCLRGSCFRTTEGMVVDALLIKASWKALVWYWQEHESVSHNGASHFVNYTFASSKGFLKHHGVSFIWHPTSNIHMVEPHTH